MLQFAPFIFSRHEFTQCRKRRLMRTIKGRRLLRKSRKLLLTYLVSGNMKISKKDERWLTLPHIKGL